MRLNLAAPLRRSLLKQGHDLRDARHFYPKFASILLKCQSRAQLQTYHHPRASNCRIHVADYCWSVFREWERADSRTYNLLKGRLAPPEFAVFRSGDQTTYC